jgi:hypothetical protein
MCRDALSRNPDDEWVLTAPPAALDPNFLLTQFLAPIPRTN